MDILKLLTDGGPWGMTVICMLVIRHLWATLKEERKESKAREDALQDKVFNLLDKQNELLKAIQGPREASSAKAPQLVPG